MIKDEKSLSISSVSDRVLLLQSCLQQFRQNLLDESTFQNPSVFTSMMDDFLEFIRTYDDVEAFNVWAVTGQVAEFRAVFGPAVLRFIEAIEVRTCAELLSGHYPRSVKMSERLGENKWGAYRGMEESLRLFDHSACRRFLLIGCGPVPDSLFCLHDCTNLERIDGVDKNADAVCMARRLVETFGLNRIQLEVADAGDVDCAEYDMICCSAFITPREKTLSRILSTARRGSFVIVRDPVFTGTLLFEPMLHTLPPQIARVAESATARGRFMLKYHILRII